MSLKQSRVCLFTYPDLFAVAVCPSLLVVHAASGATMMRNALEVVLAHAPIAAVAMQTPDALGGCFLARIQVLALAFSTAVSSSSSPQTSFVKAKARTSQTCPGPWGSTGRLCCLQRFRMSRPCCRCVGVRCAAVMDAESQRKRFEMARIVVILWACSIR